MRLAPSQGRDQRITGSQELRNSGTQELRNQEPGGRANEKHAAGTVRARRNGPGMGPRASFLSRRGSRRLGDAFGDHMRNGSKLREHDGCCAGESIGGGQRDDGRAGTPRAPLPGQQLEPAVFCRYPGAGRQGRCPHLGGSGVCRMWASRSVRIAARAVRFGATDFAGCRFGSAGFSRLRERRVLFRRLFRQAKRPQPCRPFRDGAGFRLVFQHCGGAILGPLLFLEGCIGLGAFLLLRHCRSPDGFKLPRLRSHMCMISKKKSPTHFCRGRRIEGQAPAAELLGPGRNLDCGATADPDPSRRGGVVAGSATRVAFAWCYR